MPVALADATPAALGIAASHAFFQTTFTARLAAFSATHAAALAIAALVTATAAIASAAPTTFAAQFAARPATTRVAADAGGPTCGSADCGHAAQHHICDRLQGSIPC